MLNGSAFAVSELRPTPLGRAHAATRLGALVLALGTALSLPPNGVVGLAPGVGLALAWTGLGWSRQLAALRPWAPIGALMLVLHTFTTVSAAPLWQPSWAGLLAGLVALVRVAASVGLLGLYLRVSTLDDLIVGTAWWLAPLRRLGIPVDELGLVLAVALGTVPVVVGEGRRIEMVVRLRRSGPTAVGDRRSLPARWARSVLDRARVVVPLLESLARRADALSLSLRRRRPSAPRSGRPPVAEMAALVVWLGLLIWSPW